jgi:hypothetical protein
MLQPSVDALLGALRQQLDALVAGGALSRDQVRAFRRLATLHDRATAVFDVVVPTHDAAFEAAAPVAFPAAATPSHLALEPMLHLRQRLGFASLPAAAPALGAARRLPGGGMPSGLDDWDVVGSSSSPGGAALLVAASPGGAAAARAVVDGDVPALFTIVDPPPPSSPEAVFDHIHILQGDRCAACNAKIDRSRFGLGPFKARWCHELNGFCCVTCVTGNCQCVLPAYALLRWDFSPKVVRDAYGAEFEATYSRPTLCPGAERPQLFDQIPALQELRRLRLQLSKLHEIGAACPAFLSALAVEPERPVLGAAPANPSGKATFYVAERQRYLVQESEMWSLRDLEQIARATTTVGGGGGAATAVAASTASLSQVERRQQQQAAAMASPLAKCLQSVRDAMIRHVLQECDDCKLRAAHICLACNDPQNIYSFDVRNVVDCVRCGAVFHRKCWEGIQRSDGTCPGCSGKTL